VRGGEGLEEFEVILGFLVALGEDDVVADLMMMDG